MHALLGARIAVLAALPALMATGSAAGRVHTVGQGETLDTLSRRFAVSVATLAQANGIRDPDRILAGSTLTVPVAPPPGARPARARAVPIPADRVWLQPVFERYARANGVPADLVMALAWQESGWQRAQVSWRGAVGVMQLMPDTVEFVSRILLRSKHNLDPRDPVANIRVGTRFLRYLLDRSDGAVEPALAAYHQGLRSVRERGAMAESRRFAANVMAIRARL
jgi:soluble lytic murein transglycosylase-like protein